MNLTNLVRLVSDPLLTLAYPQTCAICGASVEQRALGSCCRSCWQATRIFNDDDSLCWKCGVVSSADPISPQLTPTFCHRCDAQPFNLARAIGFYKGALRESVLQLKRQPYLPEIVDMNLGAVLNRLSLTEIDLVVPVPLHPRRLKQRGFNQAAVIANFLSKLSGLPVIDDTLSRTAHSEKYRAGLDPKGRHDTVARSFSLVNEHVIRGSYVLLVDDVFTTGATVSACADVLLRSGARGVEVITIARSHY